jgi:4-amino-4-deoxy-L-arabinose transferase-like glycosyltransferase
MKLPPTGWTLAGLLAIYVFAGLFGHDPWKSEDVVHLAIARDFLDASHSQVFFSLAGHLAAPLYYWSAALTGFVFGGMLPLHDALRLASGLWTALALGALYYAGREWYGKESAAATPILLIGSVGLIVRVHEAQPMLTLLAAESLMLLALALLPRKGRAALFSLALAIFLAALGAGISGLLPLLALGFLPLCLRYPPGAVILRPWGAGMLLGAMLTAAAGFLLHVVAPEWLGAWLRQEQRFLTDNWRYGDNLRAYAALLPWFSWPLLPLAGWTLWQARRIWKSGEILRQNARLLLPLGAFFLLLLLLPACLAARESTALLLLPPLSLLATQGVLTLRRGAANAFDWFSGMVFCVFALLLWVGWSALVFGYPARLAQRAAELSPGFVGRFSPWLFLLAAAITLWWLRLLLQLPRSPWRCLVRWSAGLITLWLLAVSLWLPWIDYGKSYRQLAAALAAQLPKGAECIAEWRLGEAQRASFAYFERLAFTPLQAAGEGCRWLLIQDNPRAEAAPPGKAWQSVWEGRRPGDRKERFRLYRRVENSALRRAPVPNHEEI